MVLLVIGPALSWVASPATESPNVNRRALVDHAPHRLFLIAPSVVAPGERFELHAQCWDYCERIARAYEGRIRFNTTDPGAALPGAYRFQGGVGGDAGRRTFTATLNGTGVHYISVRDDRGNVAWSNPIWVRADPPFRIYWGDIHSHSSLSDGSGDPNELYRYAREIAKLDFASVIDHDHFLVAFDTVATAPALWAYVKAVTNKWNDPGAFATLVGYEYRGEFGTKNSVGDINVYSRGEDLSFFSGTWDDYSTPDRFIGALRDWSVESDTPVIGIPHHPAQSVQGLSFDWSYYPEIADMVPLVEVYSVHGSSEMRRADGNPLPLEDNGGYCGRTERGYHVQDALAMGCQVGFIASSDSHDGHPGHSLSHTDANHQFQYPFSWASAFMGGAFRQHHIQPGGLAAVYAEECTREAVFDALAARQCYGISNVGRMLLDLRINGQRVGENDSTVRLDSMQTTRRIDILAAATGGDGSTSIASIELVKNNEVFRSVSFDTPTRWVNLTFEDATPLSGMVYDHGLQDEGEYCIHAAADRSSGAVPPGTDGAAVYYLRMEQTDGECGWVGPLWVECESGPRRFDEVMEEREI